MDPARAQSSSRLISLAARRWSCVFCTLPVPLAHSPPPSVVVHIIRLLPLSLSSTKPACLPTYPMVLLAPLETETTPAFGASSFVPSSLPFSPFFFGLPSFLPSFPTPTRRSRGRPFDAIYSGIRLLLLLSFYLSPMKALCSGGHAGDGGGDGARRGGCGAPKGPVMPRNAPCSVGRTGGFSVAANDDGAPVGCKKRRGGRTDARTDGRADRRTGRRTPHMRARLFVRICQLLKWAPRSFVYCSVLCVRSLAYTSDHVFMQVPTGVYYLPGLNGSGGSAHRRKGICN